MDIAKDAISELSLITGAFNAEYGKAMSGIVNIVTKEGTPKYHAGITAATDGFGGKENNWGTSRNIINIYSTTYPFSSFFLATFYYFNRSTKKTSSTHVLHSFC